MAETAKIDATGLHYSELNVKIKDLVRNKGVKKLKLENLRGQRYIGTGLQEKDVEIEILSGVPGSDMAMFMDGPTIRVLGNAQDGIGNTMNNGKVIVHGDAGDVVAYGMRNGKIFIKGDVGYRVGIHMKEYNEMVPKLVIGGCAGDFLGEYMAGGIVVLLGLTLKKGENIVGNLCATGMHGGKIYIRGDVDPFYLGKEVKVFDLNDEDKAIVKGLVAEFCAEFPEYNVDKIMKEKFIKLIPVSKRPYGNLYSPGNFFPRALENYVSSAKEDIEDLYY